MKAFLYDRLGAVVAVYDVLDNPPPNHLEHRGQRFNWRGSGALLTDDGVEQIGWDYLQQIDGSPSPEVGQ